MNFIMVFKVLADFVILPHVIGKRMIFCFGQTHSSLCICVSFIKQVNPPWHLLSESLNKNTTEEKSVKPVALTYLTVVCELNSESLRSQCLSLSLSRCLLFSAVSPILCFAAVCKSQHVLLSNRKAQNK